MNRKLVSVPAVFWEDFENEQMDALEAQVKQLRAACEFYADEGNYENDTLYINGKEIPNSSYCKIDGGDIARAAIAKAKGEDCRREDDNDSD